MALLPPCPVFLLLLRAAIRIGRSWVLTTTRISGGESYSCSSGRAFWISRICCLAARHGIGLLGSH